VRASIRTQYPCARCVHREKCAGLLARLAAALTEECLAQPRGYEPPTVIVDCEGRFSPPARYRPLVVK